jgi:hypothetical protein
LNNAGDIHLNSLPRVERPKSVSLCGKNLHSLPTINPISPNRF